MEKVFGYDYVDGKLVANDEEAKIVKFLYDKLAEYTEHPPKELVDGVLEAAQENGEILTYEEAEERVSYSAIMWYINKEIYANAEFKETLDKLGEPRLMYVRRSDGKDNNSTPIISKEDWNKMKTELVKSRERELFERTKQIFAEHKNK